MEPVSDGPTNELGLDLASPGARIGARVVDSVIGFGVVITLFFIIIAVNDVDLSDTNTDLSEELSGGANLVIRFAPLLVWMVYEIYLTATRGQTVGKIVTRIKVVSADGDRPALSPAVTRWAVLVLPVVLIPNIVGLAGFLLIGLWFLWDGNGQGIHDKSARTYVVKAPIASRDD